MMYKSINPAKSNHSYLF